MAQEFTSRRWMRAFAQGTTRARRSGLMPEADVPNVANESTADLVGAAIERGALDAAVEVRLACGVPACSDQPAAAPLYMPRH